MYKPVTVEEFTKWVLGDMRGWGSGQAWKDAMTQGVVRERYPLSHVLEYTARHFCEITSVDDEPFTPEEFTEFVDSYPWKRVSWGWEMVQHKGSPEFQEKRGRAGSLLDMGEARMAVCMFETFLLGFMEDVEGNGREDMKTIMEEELEYRESHYFPDCR